jgi:hypothetical protein
MGRRENGKWDRCLVRDLSGTRELSATNHAQDHQDEDNHEDDPQPVRHRRSPLPSRHPNGSSSAPPRTSPASRTACRSGQRLPVRPASAGFELLERGPPSVMRFRSVPPVGGDPSGGYPSIECAFRFDRTVLAVDDNLGGCVFLRSANRRIDSQLFGIERRRRSLTLTNDPLVFFEDDLVTASTHRWSLLPGSSLPGAGPPQSPVAPIGLEHGSILRTRGLLQRLMSVPTP